MYGKVGLNQSKGHHPSLQGVLYAGASAILAEIILGFNYRHSDYLISIGRMCIVFLALFTIHRFALLSLSSFRTKVKDLLTLNLVLILVIVIVAIGKVIAVSLFTYLSKDSLMSGFAHESLSFALPIATGGLILQAILGLHYGIVFALSISLILGVYFPNEPILVPFSICTTLVACLSFLRFRSRSAYIKAGINVAVIALPFALASLLIGSGFTVSDGLIRIVGALAGGILCTFLAAGLSPLFEYVGGYVTDMRLIEMATLDHPLLKELSIQAPGTWNHSMVMGMMVEAAADAIGVNPILARVGAYFHDIGKTKKPLYFVENQAGEENRHDKLSPSMSALIIKSHVKDGIELARKHGLPQALEDMIPEHHGTSMIEYFFDKAVKEAKDAGDEAPEVDRSLYSYPGPKPQTREAGILMLADGIEAASRTLPDPSADRIQGMVQKLINKTFASGELDECELTLKDLHLIAKSFTRVLTGIYHQRIAYAEPAEKIREEAPRKEVGGSGSSKKGQDQTEEKEHKESPKEDLKRLGM